MGFLGWQNVINLDAVLCKDTQKFTGVCVWGGDLESLWASSPIASSLAVCSELCDVLGEGGRAERHRKRCI